METIPAWLEARQQLTEAEAQQLRAMLDRTALSTMMHALACLCEEQRSRAVETGDSCGARHWATGSLDLSAAGDRARRNFGV
jgi:hypothetical protein